MRRVVIPFLFFAVLSGCTEILRKPTFNLNAVENPDAEVEYVVTGYDMTPDLVTRANDSPFIRYVNLGGSNAASVKRVAENALFHGAKLPSNSRPVYVIGVGDSLGIQRSGYGLISNGIQTRQSSRNTYVVNENGAVDLLEGPSVLVKGLTIAQAEAAVASALKTESRAENHKFAEAEFPVARPPVYRLGVGDVILVSRLIERTNGDGALEPVVHTNQSVVGSNGVVSILQLGEIEAGGLTLPEVRDLVLQEAIRNAGGIDTVVEIQTFASQSALITGDLGTKIVPITDRPLSYDRLIAELEPSFEGGRDYRVVLERNGETYQMNARDIVLERSIKKYHVFDGDRISIQELLPPSQVTLSVLDFSARKLTYLRITDVVSGNVQPGRTIPFDLRGMDLRQVLVNQGINLSRNEDLLVRVNRRGRTYMLSAQSVILENSGRRYWLEPDDHIVVEDIPYVGDQALLLGEIGAPRQFSINQFRRTTLSQALFGGKAFDAENADFRHVYVLRGKDLKYEAYHFDITEILNLSLAETFELRPGDIVFVRTRPLTRYTRALSLALKFFGTLETAVQKAS
ncbi:polysaccharide biosynthesis/export family protein [Cognatishimia sp. SS12]|uniref:polysaccharide biosynthesis/export family protein n=1 Tax=Cognatishimia sp. SS12 TaxID=2979465 RepID=UPI00232D3EAD|nr:polysaccharide biosynthesis/export family protein [Cognatishimia sp. SS12]MDC0739706.1 polysaccharide biosynthesis/export family protein [Cognatishimia sp. SS12]